MSEERSWIMVPTDALVVSELNARGSGVDTSQSLPMDMVAPDASRLRKG